jgi:hypothetical protein
MAINQTRTIGEVQAEFEAVLARLGSIHIPQELYALKAFCPPAGMSVRVSLRKSDTHRQIRRTADASYWNPLSCEAVISFEPDDGADGSDPALSSLDSPQGDSLLEELIKLLDRAERDPRFREFVGIKSFRDKYLPENGGAWVHDVDKRRDALARAIEMGMIERWRVPNPKDPSFPTTAIRLKRDHQDAARVLASSAAERSAFKPEPVRGGPISATIISERR